VSNFGAVVQEYSPDWMREQYTEQYYEYVNYTRNKQWDLSSIHHRDVLGNRKVNVDEVLNYIHSINPTNCKTKSEEDLHLKVNVLSVLIKGTIA
jgi:hypothetical protein